MFKVDFGYTDEFGQESKLVKTYTDTSVEEIGAFEILLDDFKAMLLASGFTDVLVDRIRIVD